MEQTLHWQVKVAPRNAAAGVHRKVAAPYDFDASNWPSPLVADTTGQQTIALESELQVELDPRAERVIATRVQTFSSIVYRFRFAAPLSDGCVELAGQRPAVSSTSKWAGLDYRRTLSAALAVCGVLAAYFVFLQYVGQHGWYAHYGKGLAVFSLSAIASLCLAALVASLCLSKQARSAVSVLTPALGLVAFSVGTAVAFRHHKPTTAAAEAALRQGDLVRAGLEARALVDLHIDEHDGARILDDVHIVRAKAARSVYELAKIVREPWLATERKQQALAALQYLAEQSARDAYADHNQGTLDALAADLGDLNPDLRDGVLCLASTIHAGTALQAGDFALTQASLSTLQRLAPTVPVSIRPTQMPAILDVATRLTQSLGDVSARSPRARRQSLLSTITAAKSYAELIGLDPVVTTDFLAQRLQHTKDEMARADRKARARAAQAEVTPPEAAQASSDPSAVATAPSTIPVAIKHPTKAAEPTVLDPYAN